jgi:copper chaperone
MERTTIAIEGMSCAHCVETVRSALKEIEGVEVDEVRVGEATVAHDPAAVPVERITAAIEDAGYAARRA